MNRSVRLRPDDKWTPPALDPIEPRSHFEQSRRVETAAGMADVNEVVAVVDAQQK